MSLELYVRKSIGEKSFIARRRWYICLYYNEKQMVKNVYWLKPVVRIVFPLTLIRAEYQPQKIEPSEIFPQRGWGKRLLPHLSQNTGSISHFKEVKRKRGKSSAGLKTPYERRAPE